MKKYLITFIFSFCLLNSHLLKAQDTLLFKFFPLQINNLWVYYGVGGSPIGTGTWYDKYKVASTTQINNETYFVIEHTRVIISINGTFGIEPIRIFNGDIPIRIDSTNFNIYKSTNCGARTELLVDSLKARLNDTSSTCDFHGDRDACSDTSLINIFNAYRKSKQFRIHAFEGENTQTYVNGIGVTEFHWQQLMEGMLFNLRGCIINGVLYGDTSMIVGIQNTGKEIPGQFFLSQNYPNPFNPVTKIKFDISPDSRLRGNDIVILKIFDVLSREITTLVNEKLKPGTYEVEWDASNYPSGVYFYKLITADYSETKKMVLIK